MKKILWVVLSTVTLLQAQRVDPSEGLWQGYDGEWGHVSRQLVALAEAVPVDKYGWRPAPGVRSTSEVFMHIAIANFYLLSATGVKMPDDLKSADLETKVTQKPAVLSWLRRSLDEVRTAHAGIAPAELRTQNKGLRTGRDCRRCLSPNPCSCQRAHGPVDRLRSRKCY